MLNLDEVELSGPLPRFLKTPNFYSVNSGDTAILECAVAELDDKKVMFEAIVDVAAAAAVLAVSLLLLSSSLCLLPFFTRKR